MAEKFDAPQATPSMQKKRDVLQGEIDDDDDVTDGVSTYKQGQTSSQNIPLIIFGVIIAVLIFGGVLLSAF